ncbi:transposase [Amycolatopsis sp. cmx-8-4]|uniref:transposase n=1 Tax=Amycolatopsis sp. cmx-8-4 TaxID=2790947 RepID=UPI00397C30C5
MGRGGGVRPAAPDDAGSARFCRSDRLVSSVGGRHAGQGGKRGDLTGPSPVDRGKPGSKIHAMSERGGIPLSVVISAANRNDHLSFEAVVDEVAPVAGPVGRPRRRPRKLHADKGYDYATCRKALRRRVSLPGSPAGVSSRPSGWDVIGTSSNGPWSGFPGSGGWCVATSARPPISWVSPSWPAR